MIQYRRTLPRGPLTRVIAAGQAFDRQQRITRAVGVNITTTTKGTIVTPKAKPAPRQEAATTTLVPRWG